MHIKILYVSPGNAKKILVLFYFTFEVHYIFSRNADVHSIVAVPQVIKEFNLLTVIRHLVYIFSFLAVNKYILFSTLTSESYFLILTFYIFDNFAFYV